MAGNGGRRWNPEVVRAWQRIARDTVIIVIGGFMLIWQTVFVIAPNAILVGAGLVLLGLPPALRIDQGIRDRKEED